jgi:hypothetical protein
MKRRLEVSAGHQNIAAKFCFVMRFPSAISCVLGLVVPFKGSGLAGSASPHGEATHLN